MFSVCYVFNSRFLVTAPKNILFCLRRCKHSTIWQFSAFTVYSDWLQGLVTLTGLHWRNRLAGLWVLRLNCCWSLPVKSFLASGLIEIYEQDFCSVLDMYVFRSGAPFRRWKGSAVPCRRYVCCAVVSARVYPRCHSVQVAMGTVRPLSLHYAK
jgi:hypothetical protein